jgi:hypothetical protein
MPDTTITITDAGATAVTVTGPTTTVRTNVPTVPNPRYWGNLVSTASQPNPVASDINLVTFSALEEGNGVTLTNTNRINLTNAGTYCLMLVINLTKTDSGEDDAYFWLRKNGSDVANSTQHQRLDGNNVHELVICQWTETVTAGQYLQVAWASPDADLSLTYAAAATTPTRPATPSVHAHIFQIGD